MIIFDALMRELDSVFTVFKKISFQALSETDVLTLAIPQFQTKGSFSSKYDFVVKGEVMESNYLVHSPSV